MITRERARELVDHKYFQWFIMAVIVINAVTLGMETAPNLVAHTGGLPTLAARVALAIFVVELLLRSTHTDGASSPTRGTCSTS